MQRRSWAACPHRRIICASSARPWSGRIAPASRTGFSIQLLPVDASVIANSAYPVTRNDGLLWSGRGLNSMVTLGARAQWGPFSAALAPTFAYQSNGDVTIVELDSIAQRRFGQFANPWYLTGIDMPHTEPRWAGLRKTSGSGLESVTG
jgi:hypothetical protein